MKSLDLHERLINYLTYWETSVNRSNSFGYTNKNIGSETLYMNMLNIAHGHNLIEASTESVNFPAVDLIDRSRGIAVQITSKNSLREIKDRIDKFFDNGMDEEFGDFIFYIIGERSKSIKPGDKYRGIHLDTDVIGTKMFIEAVRAENKLQEVCDYLESEIIPKATHHKAPQEVKNEVLAGAVFHTGATLNVTTGSQTVNITPQSLSFDSNNPLLALNGGNAQSGDADIAYLTIDENRQELDYAVSKLSENGLRGIESYEIDAIYEILDGLEDTQFADLAAVLWLLLYFENSSLNSPPLELKNQGVLKKQALSYSLSQEHYQILENFELFQATSKKLWDSIECIEKAKNG